jgi:AcrR family transcriptional regulator
MSPRSKMKSEELRLRSRTLILKAAMELFAHKGYASTTTEEIARKAGISKGLIYHHFKNKETLLIALLDEFMMKTLGFTELEARNSEASGETLVKFIRLWFREIRTNPALVKLGIQFHNDPDMVRIARTKQDAMLERYLTAFALLFRDLGFEDPEMEVFLLGSLMDGIGLNYHSMPDAVPLDRIEHFLIQYYSKRRS